MKLIIAILMVSSLVAADTNKWGVEDSDGVSSLTHDNFADFIQKHEYVFVKFFAPWCGHCKKMAPSYAALAKKYDDSGANVILAEVDVTKQTELGTKYGIKGYPTLKFFFHGEAMDYSGDREAESIEKWIDKKLLIKPEEVSTVDKLKELAASRLSVVLYGSELSSALLNRYKAVSGSLEKISFYTTTLVEAREHLTDPSHTYGLIVFRNFDDGKKVLSSNEELTTDAMKNFVESVRFALVMDFDEETAQDIFGNQKTSLFYFTEDSENVGLTAVKKLASTKRWDIIFSKSSINDGMGKRLAEYLGVTPNDNNTIRLVKFVGADLNKYKLESVTEETLETFINDFMEDKLTPYRKSEKPVENDTAPVKTVVGLNFDDLVINNDNYVLLEVYAPWCGHCKQLIPIYNQLAEKVAGVKNLVIAKMDGTANEHPSVQIRGFPTIKFFKKGSKSSPSNYEGERDLKGFMAYLKQQMGEDWIGESDLATEEL